jgi:rhamnulokinase
VGLFIARRLYDECFPNGETPWDEVTKKAAALESPGILFDPNDDVFFNPLSMRKAIINKTAPASPDNFFLFRLVYDSLAQSYKHSFEEIERIRGRTYETIYIVGGGSRNNLLNQITAGITGKKAAAGPDEATSLGNMGSQLLYNGRAKDLSDIRRVIRESIQIDLYGD